MDDLSRRTAAEVLDDHLRIAKAWTDVPFEDVLAEELPEHAAFDYAYVAAEGCVGLLEWSYEDSTVRVRDGVDSYVIENGKIVAQTIHYTLESRGDAAAEAGRA